MGILVVCRLLRAVQVAVVVGFMWSLLGCSGQSDGTSEPAQTASEASAQEQVPSADDSAMHSAGDEPGAVEASGEAPVVLADDGYPAGPTTPEGAACDLARAFINVDSQLFRDSCLPVPGGDAGDEYGRFIEQVAAQMDAKAGKPLEQFSGPKRIVRVYTARHLSLNGPGSYAYAVHGLHDVQFVDVEAELWGGEIFKNRTLVVMDSEKRWFVMPRPDLFPLMSVGLNDESASTEEWSR